MAFCRLITVLVLVHITGGLDEVEMGFIFRGQDAPKDRWPWMVHLNITSDGIKKWRCGGTILNNDWVLTAARCWDKSLKPNYRRSMVWAGVHSLQKGAVSYCGIKFEPISHPAYGAVGDGYVNDLALVKLDRKLTFTQSVGAVGLPSVDDTFGPESECWITGWGNTGTGVPLPDPETLQELKINIVPNIVCETQYPELTSDMLCAGDMTRRKDLCTGDYGGPLVCRRGSGFVQVGIMSFGSPNGCAFAFHPGIFTRVSKYLDFITSVKFSYGTVAL